MCDRYGTTAVGRTGFMSEYINAAVEHIYTPVHSDVQSP